MKVNEIFYSLQGEGKWTGLPNIFIRTTGCNLRCSYCDTKYAYYDGKEMSVNDIYNKIKSYSCNNVCITGGEPLEQNETFDLIDLLLKNKYKIGLETNGSKSIKNLINKKSLLISLDIKCPSSKMQMKNCFENINLLRKNDQLKFIIKDKKDFDYAKKIIKKYNPACDVFLQPLWRTNPSLIASWITNDNLNVRLGLQIHKILWGDKKGV